MRRNTNGEVVNGLSAGLAEFGSSQRVFFAVFLGVILPRLSPAYVPQGRGFSFSSGRFSIQPMHPVGL
jgi:hypothetical protein